VTVHAHGMARAIEDAEWILDVLNRLTDAQESRRDTPWKVSDAPADYIDQMLRALVGIDIMIERLEGRLKVSLVEDEKDRLGTVEGLRGMSHASAQILSDLVLCELTQLDGGPREG
jgi:transcriptional regulator